jgi:hypothetical protein
LGADHHNHWDGSGDDSSYGEGIGMIKPIEAGCLAIVVVHPCWNEPIHTAIVDSHAGYDMGICAACGCFGKWWEITSETVDTSEYNYCECTLRRIDGGDPDAEITETDKENEYANND